MSYPKVKSNAENFNLRDILLLNRRKKLKDRLSHFQQYSQSVESDTSLIYRRELHAKADRVVRHIDPNSRKKKEMLMFGSNNYLGLANHPYVKEKVINSIKEYGVGIGGPPLLNGYTNLHRELEERLSSLKGTDSTILFSSGFGANIGVTSAILGSGDLVIQDEYCHASFGDGLKQMKANSIDFRHNSIEELSGLLNSQIEPRNGEVFVAVEGVYSMDGDLAPLDKIAPLCKSKNAVLIVDDAHGTGVMGKNGSGTANHFNVDHLVDITVGTFSKAFGVCGGFVSGSKELINYMRYFARSYMFSASLPPVIVSTVLACLDVIENEPWIIDSLHNNVRYCTDKLKELNIETESQSGIVILKAPASMNIRKAGVKFHKAGIFLNTVEYPAVPVNKQRFRISLMSTHTKNDIDRLVECIEDVMLEYN